MVPGEWGTSARTRVDISVLLARTTKVAPVAAVRTPIDFWKGKYKWKCITINKNARIWNSACFHLDIIFQTYWQNWASRLHIKILQGNVRKYALCTFLYIGNILFGPKLGFLRHSISLPVYLSSKHWSLENSKTYNEFNHEYTWGKERVAFLLYLYKLRKHLAHVSHFLLEFKC